MRTSIRSRLADDTDKPLAEVGVHEGVDDGVGDVVGEVHVEDGHAVRQDAHGHRQRREERDDKHERHDKQHCSRFDAGNTIAQGGLGRHRYFSRSLLTGVSVISDIGNYTRT